MLRDLANASAARYDLLVVGGGIHGLFAAYDAASRGLSVVLVERGDYGSGLSFNHQRTIHGGLRDIERFRFTKAQEHVRERRAWAVMAPHLIRPLPFLVGTYRWTKRSRLALRAGLALYDRVSRLRNDGIPAELHLPPTKLESGTATRRLFPQIAEQNLTGGAVWYDYQTQHPDRLNWCVAMAAKAAGARLINYAEAIAPLRTANRVAGARVRDHLTGREYDIHSTATLLAAGSGLSSLLQRFGLDGGPPLVRAMNLLLDRPARDLALVAPGSSGRMLTMVPWRGHALVGTFQSPEFKSVGDDNVTSAVMDSLLADANHAFPHLAVSRRDVRLVHQGLTPAHAVKGRAELLPESVINDHSKQAAGVFSLVGVKFTTARQAAERAIDLIAHAGGNRPRPCVTAKAALPHAGVANAEGLIADTLRSKHVTLEPDVLEHLGSWYGTEAPAVVAWCADRALTDRIDPSSPVLTGEITYAIAHSDAKRLADVVLRRTPLGSAGHPGDAALSTAADVMGAEFGWTESETKEEIRQVLARYEPSARG